MNYFVTSTNISDSAGTLLFYSDGRFIMNRYGDTLMNGFGFSPQLAAFVDYAYSPGQGFQIFKATSFYPRQSQLTAIIYFK